MFLHSAVVNKGKIIPVNQTLGDDILVKRQIDANPRMHFGYFRYFEKVHIWIPDWLCRFHITQYLCGYGKVEYLWQLLHAW